MSRRHTSTTFPRALTRALVASLSIALLVTALLPAFVSAQGKARDTDLYEDWQLLTYRTAAGKQEPVPAGVGARVLMFAGSQVLGSAACSTYEATWDRVGGNNLFFRDIEPDYVECDPASLAFDEIFYRHLEGTASFRLDGSILELYDDVETRLMVLTSAKINDDPTVARWDLARIGGADGSVDPVIAGLDPWIEFLEGGSVVGSSACGSFLGTYATQTGTMDITDVRYRLRDCTESALDQAERMIATLAEITNFEVRPAGLVLQDENRTTRLAFTPELGLNRRTWTPTAIYTANGDLKYGEDKLATSAVKFDGPAAEGITICQPFTAESTRSGLALTVDADSVEYWGDPCPKKTKNGNLNLAAIEKSFMNALFAASSHALRGSELELMDVAGNPIMTLQPQAELEGPTWVVTGLGALKGNAKLREPVGDIDITVTFDEVTNLVEGDTGAGAASAGKNTYLAFYDLPEAARINVDDINLNVDVQGRACRGSGGKRKTTAVCKQEASFLKLLSEVDTYIVKENILRLRVGNRVVMALEPA